MDADTRNWYELTSARDQYNEATELIAQWRASAGNEVTAAMGAKGDNTNKDARLQAMRVIDDIAASRYMRAKRVFTDRIAQVYREATES